MSKESWGNCFQLKYSQPIDFMNRPSATEKAKLEKKIQIAIDKLIDLSEHTKIPESTRYRISEALEKVRAIESDIYGL